MTLEDILTSLIEKLTTLNWKEPQDLLQTSNEVLHPLKESGELFHYYFSMREKDEEVLITVFLQKDEQSPLESWELSISSSGE